MQGHPGYPLIAVDFGAPAKLRAFKIMSADDQGSHIDMPRLPRGVYKNDAEKFAGRISELLKQGHVITESATIGSSGAEPEMFRDIVLEAPHQLYTVSNRTVKNIVGYTSEGPSDIGAQTQARVANENPAALQLWRYRTEEEKLQRVHTSVRPMDKRGYDDEAARGLLEFLPPPDSLPMAAAEVFCKVGKDGSAEYDRKLVIPFAMAMRDEPFALASRRQFELVVGLYAHGYPSFYRRATIATMQRCVELKRGEPFRKIHVQQDAEMRKYGLKRAKAAIIALRSATKLYNQKLR